MGAYFGRAETSNVIGEELSEMLKFPALEIYCFTLLIVFVLTRQETIKNNNTEQYLLFSNSGRFYFVIRFRWILRKKGGRLACFPPGRQIFHWVFFLSWVTPSKTSSVIERFNDR